MGDVHPHALKAELARELSRITFERWTQQIQNQAPAKPFSAIPVLKPSKPRSRPPCWPPANAASSRFDGAYHGLGYGALNATHRDFFRSPFQLATPRVRPFRAVSRRRPRDLADRRIVRSANFFRRERIGAILVEPVQARGGINVPPPEFLPLLRKLCDEHGALLILDEIYTGFGRTGKWFACEHSGVVPDLICLGKALTGGFPLSACVGRADLMDAAWPASTRRGHSHQHVSRPSRRLRDGAGANRGNSEN